MSSQSQFISRLEKRCQCGDSPQSQAPEVGEWAVLLPLFNVSILPTDFKEGTQNGLFVCLFFSLCWFGQVTSAPPKTQPNVHPNYSSGASEMTNDVQRDQSAPALQPDPAVHSLPDAPSNTPTDPPFISFPVTKTPGRFRPSMSVRAPGAPESFKRTSLWCCSYLAEADKRRLQGVRDLPAGGLISLGMTKQCEEQLAAPGVWEEADCKHTRPSIKSDTTAARFAQAECLK